MKAAVTGHRPNKLGHEYNFIGPVTEHIKAQLFKWLDDNKPDKIISGMALGVDQIWAVCGIRRNIPVIAAIPCAKQEAMWRSESVRVYNAILDNDLVTSYCVSKEPYTPACMQDRNIWMVDNCDILVAVWNGTPGGTANCIEYAKEVGKEIFIVKI